MNTHGDTTQQEPEVPYRGHLYAHNEQIQEEYAGRLTLNDEPLDCTHYGVHFGPNHSPSWVFSTAAVGNLDADAVAVLNALRISEVEGSLRQVCLSRIIVGPGGVLDPHTSEYVPLVFAQNGKISLIDGAAAEGRFCP